MLKQVNTDMHVQIIGCNVAASRIKRRLFTFTLKLVERRGEQEPVGHVRRSGTTSDACKNTLSSYFATSLT